MTPPEAPLWALFDQIGLPFRETLGDLIARFGAAPSEWSAGLFLCNLPARPLLAGAGPVAVQWHKGADPTLPPEYLSCAYRGTRWTASDALTDGRAVQNFVAVLGALEGLLGPGGESSASNTLARRWQFGAAEVQALVWPPSRNRAFGPNRRHEVDPASAHECLITLRPAWMPDLTAREQEWLAGYQPLGHIARRIGQPGWRRVRAAPGFGLSRGGEGFVAVDGDFAKLLPRADLIALHREVLTPAKGGGGVELVLTHAPAGLPDVSPHRLILAQAAYAPGTLADLARDLAHALALPLHESEWSDC